MEKLKRLLDLCDEIRKSSLSGEEQYDLIFSENISQPIYAHFASIGVRLDYYDPDTSYEEDMDAFINAAKDAYSQLSFAPINEQDTEQLKTYFKNKAKKYK